MSLTINDLTVIVVTYNSAHCIPELARTLAKLPHVVFVDNASEDNTVEIAQRLVPEAAVAANSHNLGFGAANNIALRKVKTPYALLLNPDCAPNADFFHSMLAAAEIYTDAAIIAPDLIQSRPNPHALIANGACCADNVSGAAMLLNMRVMQEVGFFDERFFLYYEDEDLCRRAYELRKNIIFLPEVKLVHFARGSVKGPSLLKGEYLRGYHHAQSKLIFDHKHVRSESVSRLRAKVLVLALLTLIPRLLFPQPRYLARLLGRICGLISFKLL